MMKAFIQKITLFFLILCSSSFLNAQNFDIELLRSINLNRNTSLDPSMQLISNSEGVIGVGIPISVVLIGFAKKDEKLFENGVNMSLALVANTLNTVVLKRTINRARPAATYPEIEAYESERNFSFPSGHTSNAFCTATSLSLNFPKWYVMLPSYTWAASVAYSRMHLGMHYPSDVLMGAIVGAGSAYVTFKANQWLKKYYHSKFIFNSF